MTFAIIWKKEAEDDFAAGLEYYLEKGGENLYYKFFDDVNSCIYKLQQHPQHYG